MRASPVCGAMVPGPASQVHVLVSKSLGEFAGPMEASGGGNSNWHLFC